MSLHSYLESQHLYAEKDRPFSTYVMCAMRKADTHNARHLQLAFPDIWDELQQRYGAPGGRINGEAL